MKLLCIHHLIGIDINNELLYADVVHLLKFRHYEVLDNVSEVIMANLGVIRD
jgi:hypothetical protein